MEQELKQSVGVWFEIKKTMENLKRLFISSLGKVNDKDNVK